jgi:hypothetical protein
VGGNLPPLLPLLTLFTGSFLSANLGGSGHGGAPPGYAVNAEFLATVNQDFLDVFGMPDVLYVGSLTIGFELGPPISPLPPEVFGCSDCVDSVYISLTPVPEPSTLLLLATVAGIAWLAFRSRRVA